jgi:hypothetical protein
MEIEDHLGVCHWVNGQVKMEDTHCEILYSSWKPEFDQRVDRVKQSRFVDNKNVKIDKYSYNN